VTTLRSRVAELEAQMATQSADAPALPTWHFRLNEEFLRHDDIPEDRSDDELVVATAITSLAGVKVNFDTTIEPILPLLAAAVERAAPQFVDGCRRAPGLFNEREERDNEERRQDRASRRHRRVTS
jgi:hypothetical protein